MCEQCPGWGQVASAIEHQRYLVPVTPRSRRRCWCGCQTRATHVGMANGLAMTTGCELAIRRWVRDPNWFANRNERL